MTAVLSGEGPLSRSDPSSGHSESWPDRGPPERPMVAEGGAPGGAAPYVTGRARLKGAARGGFVNPASKGCVAHTPGASRRSIALAHFSRGTGKARTHCAARMRKAGCLKCKSEVMKRSSAHILRCHRPARPGDPVFGAA